ncbi:MAG: Crp/Fnr family transcriptional regulator [Flavobacteriaceae bacterium]|nr:Crp/Fnr family transcriptional regulator [Bacteroidia bacterium]NNK82034.1 Crp/Fnr family transcriptional regulator [Flavobacteriaceae bacterium]
MQDLKNKTLSTYKHTFEKALIDEIAMVGVYKKLEVGDILIDIDDELTHIPMILSGVVKIIRRDKNGDEIALYYLEKGNTCAISFVNCINKNKSIFRGVAEQDVEAIFIPVEYIDEWLVKYKSFRHFIIDSYHFRLLEMVDSIDSLAFLKLEERLFNYINEKMKVINTDTLEITHQELADDLNSSRTVISRLLKHLEHEGKIRMHRNRLQVI